MLHSTSQSDPDPNPEVCRQAAGDLPQADPEPLILALEFLAVIASASQLAIGVRQLSVDLAQRVDQHKRRVYEQLAQLDESYAAVELAAKQFDSLLDFFSLRDQALRTGQLKQLLTASETTEFIRLYNSITAGQKRLVLCTIRLNELVMLEPAEAQAMENLTLEADRRIQAALGASTFGRYMVEIGAGLSILDRAVDILSGKYGYVRHLPIAGSGQGRP